MEFEDIEITLKCGLTAIVSGTYSEYPEDNRFDHEFGTHDPGSGMFAEDIKISKIEFLYSEYEVESLIKEELENGQH